ncbi:MAG: sugar phosphate isomerase/epimerase, partial [Verrucomicrobia bacterium]|nr:sugar phosphate isomerase/epimerase [Verrucomicrobiota bacterium]
MPAAIGDSDARSAWRTVADYVHIFTQIIQAQSLALGSTVSMKFGINSFLLSSSFSDVDLPMIETFRSWGADIIEMAVDDPESIHVDALVRALDAAGMENCPVCGMFPTHRDLRGTEAQQQATLDYVGGLIQLAAALGSSIVAGPFYSSVGRCNLHTDAEKAQQLDTLARHLETLCRQAEKVGVTLAMEPLNRFETDFVNTLEQARIIIDKVSSPALKIHVDTFHMNIEESNSAEAIRQVGPYIGHFHASASHRGIPGQDQVHWANIFSALKDVNYDGDVVIETFSMDNKIIAKAASIWLERFASPEQLSRQGLAFLRDTWKA